MAASEKSGVSPVHSYSSGNRNQQTPSDAPHASQKTTESGRLVAENQPLPVGMQIGNYVIESLIGSGGMAQVYRVRHAMLGTPHALKVLAAHYRGFLEVRQRFLSEGQIAAQLDHRHVVQVTDAVATAEVAGLVMDLVEGPTMESYVSTQPRPLPLAQARELFLPVLDAMAEAHRRGIIHRDIKPANILLDMSQGRPVPKVTDFGIAKVLRPDRAGGEKGLRDPTRAEARMGTLSYMSPEQVRGARDVSAQSDIFSLGATLYEVCTGELAFDGDSEYEVMSSIVEGRLFRPERLAELDPVLAQAIRKALSPLPADRFTSCEEFALALVGRTAPQPQARRSGPGIESLPDRTPRAQPAALVPVVEAAPSLPAPDTTRCPFCNEVILMTARKCKHCQEYLDPSLRRAVAPSSGSPATTNTSLVPRQDWSRIKPALINFFVPGLGHLAAGSYKVGAALIAALLLLHAIGAPGGLMFMYHLAVAVLTFMLAPRWQQAAATDGEGKL